MPKPTSNHQHGNTKSVLRHHQSPSKTKKKSGTGLKYFSGYVTEDKESKLVHYFSPNIFNLWKGNQGYNKSLISKPKRLANFNDIICILFHCGSVFT